MARIGSRLLSSIVLLLATACNCLAQGNQNSATPANQATIRAAQRARETYREAVNENVLFLMGGQLGATLLQIAQDISIVLNDGNNMRILPVAGGAGVQNVHDIVFLRGIDLALTTVLSLNALKKSGELGPHLERQITYIAPLFSETMQIVARGGNTSLESLKGKKVAFNNKGSSTAVFTPLVFKALGIDVEPVFMSQPDALEKMRTGEIEATICTCPTPVPAFAAIAKGSGFRLLEVPYAQGLQEDYLPASVTSADYPNLIPGKEKIETVAGTTVLVTFNWPKGSARYDRTAKFVDAFFSKFRLLQVAPRHPLWRSVNIAASIPGWQRFSAAQDWLDRTKVENSASVEAAFAQYVKRKSAGVDLQDPDERERLFREFLHEWQTAGNKIP